MRTLLKILGWCSMIGLIAMIAFLFWLRGLWSDVYSHQQLNEIVTEARAAPALPTNFKTTLLKIHPTILSDGMFRHMFRMIPKSREFTPCPCRQLGYMVMPELDQMTRGARSFYGPSFIWAIERQVDQEQCLALLLERYDFTHGIRGIEQASQTYFGDSLTNLSEDQHIELILKFRNPMMYDKVRRPEIYRAEFDRLKERVVSAERRQ
jgi:hypothetical protein